MGGKGQSDGSKFGGGKKLYFEEKEVKGMQYAWNMYKALSVSSEAVAYAAEA